MTSAGRCGANIGFPSGLLRGIVAFEALSPLVFVTRGRLRYAVIGFFYSFHLLSFATIAISFAPHLVAMGAFLPSLSLGASTGGGESRTVTGQTDAGEPFELPVLITASGGTASTTRCIVLTGWVTRHTSTVARLRSRSRSRMPPKIRCRGEGVPQARQPKRDPPGEVPLPEPSRYLASSDDLRRDTLDSGSKFLVESKRGASGCQAFAEGIHGVGNRESGIGNRRCLRRSRLRHLYV